MTPKVKQIVAEVCRTHGVSIEDLQSRSRESWIVNIRRELISKLHQGAGLSSSQLAKVIGRRPATCRHHARLASGRVPYDR